MHRCFLLQALGPPGARLSSRSAADRRPNRWQPPIFRECSSSKAGHYHQEPKHQWCELPGSKSEASALTVSVRRTFSSEHPATPLMISGANHTSTSSKHRITSVLKQPYLAPAQNLPVKGFHSHRFSSSCCSPQQGPPSHSWTLKPAHPKAWEELDAKSSPFPGANK